MGLLDKQTAFVTGASRGIGWAIAEALAKEGAAVAAAARSEEDIARLCQGITASGGKAIPIKLDLRSEESIKQAVATARAELGPIDILINNAAVIALHPILTRLRTSGTT